MRTYSLLVGILAVWRITHLFHAEDGPWEIMFKLRRRTGQGFWGQLIECFYCLSVWVAFPVALYVGENLHKKILLWPALSAGAILLERTTDRGHGEQTALFIEESEDEYVLRQKEEAKQANRSEP